MLCLSNSQPSADPRLRHGTAAQDQTFHLHSREVREHRIYNSFLLDMAYIWKQIIWKINLVLPWLTFTSYQIFGSCIPWLTRMSCPARKPKDAPPWGPLHEQ